MITYKIEVGQIRQFARGGKFLVINIDGIRADIVKSCGSRDGVFIDWLCKNSFVISGDYNDS